MKNFIWFIIFIVVLSVGAYYFYNSFYKTSLQTAENRSAEKVEMLTTAVAMELSDVFTESGRDLELISTMFSAEKDVTNQKFAEIYNKYFEDGGYFSSLGYMNEKGDLIAIAPEKFSGELGNNYSFRDYFKESQITDKIVYSKLLDNHRPKSTEQIYKTIVIALPVHKNGKFSGIYFGQLDVSKIEKTLARVTGSFHNGQSNFYFYCLKDQKIVTRPSAEVKPDFELFLKRSFEEESEPGRIKNILSYKDKKYFINFESIMDKNKESTFELIGVFSYDELVGYFARFNKQVLFLVAFIVAIIIIVLIGVIYNEKVIKGLNVKIKHLEISINEVAKKKEVTELTETAYFQELRDKLDRIQENQENQEKTGKKKKK